MQNSILSSKIFPDSQELWSSFIVKVEKELQNMMITYNKDKRRIKDLERIINKLEEIRNISKENIIEILNYKELFMYIDNSLESSFDALNFFKEQNDFDNLAVKSIYERIITSPKILKINSEYNSLNIKVRFDKDRIKKLGELIQGKKVDYFLIEELLNKYEYSDKEKTSVMFYPLVKLSIKQNDFKDENYQENNHFYQDKFSELCSLYQKKKEMNKNLLVQCFNVRSKMTSHELDMYESFLDNIESINNYNFTDDIIFKIYTLAFFKIKKDIEYFIDGVIDLGIDSNLEDELVYFQSVISEYDNIVNNLKELAINRKNDDVIGNKVFFALDAFNRLIIKKDLLTNESNILELFYDTKDVKINHLGNVNEEEQIIGKSISILVTPRIKLAYLTVGKDILIIAGDDVNNLQFEKMVKLTIDKNIVPLRKQIFLIEESDLDYIELQNRIYDSYISNEDKKII